SVCTSGELQAPTSSVSEVGVVDILSALLLFGVWPFTRLVHVWSVPLTYLNRHYVVYRRMRAKKI
ncbi:respiratory nitrate reductase subunit gamma, partial [Anoxybacillus geothermalis]|nr:respiratory nitrate reductase subunit gamma [Anoxybacillus geothermalis]